MFLKFVKLCDYLLEVSNLKKKYLSTHFGNGVDTVMSVWDHDMGGLFESESGVALLDLELELKL